jgi:hypothetical protein
MAVFKPRKKRKRAPPAEIPNYFKSILQSIKEEKPPKCTRGRRRR